MYEPTTLHWCTSACSSSVQGITWSSWTATSAVGVGTLWVNNGIPNCLQGTWTEQTGYGVTLSAPLSISYCGDNGEARALLCALPNLWGNTSIPFFMPPCPQTG